MKINKININDIRKSLIHSKSVVPVFETWQMLLDKIEELENKIDDLQESKRDKPIIDD